MLSLVGLSLAHVPHDTILAGALPAGLDDSAPWLIVADPGRTSLLYRSWDGGRSFESINGDVLEEVPLAATTLGTTAVILGESRLWWSQDGGDSWSQSELPAVVVAMATDGDELLLFGDGIWRGVPGGIFTVEAEGVFITGGAGPVAISKTGEVWTSGDTGWSTIGKPSQRTTAAIGADGVVYVGDASGHVYRNISGVWQECASLPRPDEDVGEFAEIASFAVDGTLLLVAAGWRGPWASTDGCQSWSDASVRDPTRGGDGGAEDARDAFSFMLAAGERWVVGGWGGVYVAQDGVWSEGQTVPPAYTRGLWFAPDFEEGGALFLGPNLSGAMRTLDGGGSLTPNIGMMDENVQAIVGAPGHTAVYAVAGHRGYRSDDGGETWAAMASEVSFVDRLIPFAQPDRLWLVASGGVKESRDAGQSFADLQLDVECTVSSAAIIDGSVCLICANPVAVRCAEGVEPGGWTTWHEDEGSSAEAVGWPKVDPERLILTSTEGVTLVDRAGSRTLEPLGRDEGVSLGIADDDTLFLATRSGRVFQSEDGGETWQDMGVRLPSWPHTIAARPGYAEHGELLVATHGGVYLLRDGALDLFSGWERVENESDVVISEGPLPKREEVPGAGMAGAQPMPMGSSVSVWLRGGALRLFAGSAGAAELWVSVDGGDFEVVSFPAETPVELAWSASGLEEGWHEVRLSTASGTVFFDALEGKLPGSLLEGFSADTGGEDSGGPIERRHCGCGDGSRAALLLAGVFALRRRR